MDIGSHGACDTAIYILEAQVQVYDCGSWVADLNVLEALESPRLKHLQCSCNAQSCPSQNGQRNDEDENTKRRKNTLADRLISVDCWEEFLQRPSQAGIIRSHGNWLARLAATSLSVQKEYTTLLLPHDVCWSCIGSTEIPDDCFVIL